MTAVRTADDAPERRAEPIGARDQAVGPDLAGHREMGPQRSAPAGGARIGGKHRAMLGSGSMSTSPPFQQRTGARAAARAGASASSPTPSRESIAQLPLEVPVMAGAEDRRGPARPWLDRSRRSPSASWPARPAPAREDVRAALAAAAGAPGLEPGPAPSARARAAGGGGLDARAPARARRPRGARVRQALARGRRRRVRGDRLPRVLRPGRGRARRGSTAAPGRRASATSCATCPAAWSP